MKLLGVVAVAALALLPLSAGSATITVSPRTYELVAGSEILIPGSEPAPLEGEFTLWTACHQRPTCGVPESPQDFAAEIADLRFAGGGIDIAGPLLPQPFIPIPMIEAFAIGVSFMYVSPDPVELPFAMTIAFEELERGEDFLRVHHTLLWMDSDRFDGEVGGSTVLPDTIFAVVPFLDTTMLFRAAPGDCSGGFCPEFVVESRELLATLRIVAAAVPEPSMLTMSGLAVGGLLVMRVRRLSIMSRPLRWGQPPPSHLMAVRRAR